MVRTGRRDDPAAVVDQYGPTNLTTIMIGEKAGKWLRTRPTRFGR